MAETNIAVGFLGEKDMVSLTIGNKTIGLSPSLARDIAVDLLIWADRLNPRQPDIENQSVTD